jgi:hypothetical protein
MKYLKVELVVLILLATCAIGYAQQGSTSSPGYSSSTGQYCSGGACVQIVMAPYDWQSDDYSSFKVTLKQIGGTYTTCNSDPDGTIEFSDVPPGYYWVTVCGSPSSSSSSYSGYGYSQGQYCYYTKFSICVYRDYYDSSTWGSSDPCSNQYYAYPVKYDCSKDAYKTKFCCKGCPDCQQYTPSDQTSYSQPSGTPTIKIISPQNNAIVPAGDIPIAVKVDNLILTNELGLANIKSHGHIHYFLDPPRSSYPGTNPALTMGTFYPTPETSYTWKNVAPGTHTLMVYLSNNDHTPVTPLAMDQVAITVR